MPAPSTPSAQQKTPAASSAASGWRRAAPARARRARGTRRPLARLVHRWGAALQRWVWGRPEIVVCPPPGASPDLLLSALRRAELLQAAGYSVRLEATLLAGSGEPARCPWHHEAALAIPAGSTLRWLSPAAGEETRGVFPSAPARAQKAPGPDDQATSAEAERATPALQPLCGGVA